MRATLKVLGVFVALLLTLNQNLAAIFKLTNAVCESHNKSWVVPNRCRLRAVQRNNVTLNVNLTVLYPANNIHLKVEALKKANGYKPWLVNVTIDACAFMRKRNDPWVKLIYNFVKHSTNMNHTCPYMGTQVIKDFAPDTKKIMIPFPTGDYLFRLTWMFDRKPQFTLSVYYTYVEDFKDSRTYDGFGELLV